MKKGTKLYNVLFPIWMLIIFPQVWLFVLPANFLIDTLVLLITLKVMKVQNKKSVYKKSIVKVWLFGFASDFICAGLLMLTQFLSGDWWVDMVSHPVAFDPFSSIYAFIVVALAIFVAGLFIFFFNYKFSFRNTDLSKAEIKKAALALAVFTAPYVAFIPSHFMYY